MRNFPMQYKYFYLFIAKLKGLRPKGETFHAQVLIEMKGEMVALALCSLVSRWRFWDTPLLKYNSRLFNDQGNILVTQKSWGSKSKYQMSRRGEILQR